MPLVVPGDQVAQDEGPQLAHFGWRAGVSPSSVTVGAAAGAGARGGLGAAPQAASRGRATAARVARRRGRLRHDLLGHDRSSQAAPAYAALSSMWIGTSRPGCSNAFFVNRSPAAGPAQ